MKKILVLSLFCGLALTFHGQDRQQTLFLAKTYNSFMFLTQPTKEVLKELKGMKDTENQVVVDFITQTITTKNKILTTKYLKRPDDRTLKQVYIIRAVSMNLSEKNPVDNGKLIDSLTRADVPVYELVDNYYEMVFMAVGNKNQPFNLSKVNFKLNDYQLRDDTERGIFFLKCMRFCGTTIWGYINIAKPMNTAEAYKNIKRFPKFDGRPYYQYDDFSFDDFEMVIIKDNGKESYKGYYLDKYYETLLYHLLCLRKEGASQVEIEDLMLGSILRKRSLYSYTKYKETLEEMFKEVRRP